MRKIVGFIVLLSLLAGFTQCDNAPTPSKTEQKEKPRKRLFKKENRASEDKTETSFEIDSLEADTPLAEEPNPTPIDTEIVELPEPDEPEDIDWESSAAADTLSSDNGVDIEEEEITEEWVDEEDIDYDDGEFEDENVDYSDGDVRLKMERILKTEIVKLLIPEARDQRDSTLAVIEERMSLSPEGPSKNIVVEKWYSPVNYRGYKFNRKKLLLYGVDKAAPVDVYFYLGEYYFAFDLRVYNLDETSKNVAFESVKDSVLTKYLLNYEY